MSIAFTPHNQIGCLPIPKHLITLPMSSIPSAVPPVPPRSSNRCNSAFPWSPYGIPSPSALSSSTFFTSTLSCQLGRRQRLLWPAWSYASAVRLARAHMPTGNHQLLSRCKSGIFPTFPAARTLIWVCVFCLPASFLSFGRNSAILRLQTYLVETNLSSKVSGRHRLTNM